MFRKVDRYILREVMPPFGVALLAFLAFIALQVVIYLSDILSRGAGVGALFRLLGLKVPSLLTLAIPGGVLLAIFWALARLAGSRELLAFQAVGYSLKRLALPLLFFGAAMSVVSFALGELVVPRTEELYRREYMSFVLGGKMTSPSLQEEVFFRGPQGDLYYVHRYGEGVIRGIVVYDLAGRIAPPSGDFPIIVTAQEGRISPRGELELREGRVLHFDAAGRLVRVDGFEALRIEVGADIQRLILGGRTPAQMSLRELSARIAAMERAGVDPRALLVEYHAKIAVAASSFLFAFFGAPVGMLLGRRGRVAGAAAGFLLAGAAQALFLWTKSMARLGLLSPPWGAWLPAVPFVFLGILFLWRLDRRHLFGLLTFFLLSLGAGAAPPPFSLSADSLSFSLGERAFVASGAEVRFGDYTLVAAEVHGREEEVWFLQAEGAELSGKALSLSAATLRVEFDSQGEALSFKAQSLSGSLRFRGPEKEETLLFTAEEAEVYLHGGEMARVVAREVAFTTCPCLSGAPYAVRAEQVVYIPDEWFFARDLFLSSFGVTVWWLPFYVSRLGEEGPSLFPRIGFRGGDPYLKWSFPFTLREEVLWGAVGLTFFPVGMQAEPELWLFGENGALHLFPQGLRASGRGEWAGGEWKGEISLLEGRLRASLSGTASGWSFGAAWERIEEEDSAYEKAPEVSLRRSFSLPAGNFSLSLSVGRYVQEGTEAVKAGVGMGFGPGMRWGPFSFGLPVGLNLDLYGGAEERKRYRLSFSPSLKVGGVTLGYTGRFGGGTSPLGFDVLPPLSRLSLSFAGAEGALSQRFSLAWDLGKGEVLPGRWTLEAKDPKVNASLELIPFPLELKKLEASVLLRHEGWWVAVQGGVVFSPSPAFADLIVKGSFQGEGFSLRGGARIGPFPLALKRGVGELSWTLWDDFRLEVAGEYDFSSGKLVQGTVSLVRTIAGCLRVGLAAGTRQFELYLEIPAFPGAKLRFLPEDKTLWWGD